MKNRIVKITLSLLGAGWLVGCGNSAGSYSILATSQGFKQSTMNSKMDILWVIDNSGSMSPLQQNLVNNFNSFIQQFVTKGYDFHMAVAASDAFTYAPFFRNNPAMAKFRDGVGTNHSGVFTILPTTPNLTNVFVMNASLGAGGSGDERVFSSFRAALDSPLNAGFLRPNSFLGVIILSDEDDFSNPTRAEGDFSGGDHSYTQPGLESVDSYVSYLDTLTGSTAPARRYSVSSIAVLDEACRAQHAVAAPSTIIGQRYIEITNRTNGVLGSVCDSSFAASLQKIQERIIEMSTQFYLDAEPVVESIRISVNGVLIANDATNGWTYSAAANSVVFHGNAVPPSGANIGVYFDPVSVF